MKVIMLSGDPFILDQESNVRKRIIEYGTIISELHIIIISKKIPANSTNCTIGDNIWIYPIQSTNRLLAMSRAIATGVNLIRKIKPQKDKDLITSQDPFELGLTAFFIAKLFNLPLQLQVHNDFADKHFISESKASNLRKRIATFLLPRANGIRVVNPALKETLIKTMGIPDNKITLLPVFVDSNFFLKETAKFNLKDTYPGFSKIILMVGRLGKQKNYPLALKVLEDVLKGNPKIGLVIIGEGVEELKLKRLVKNRGLSDSVIFAGRKNDMVSYYKGADIFLHTSNYEGYGMVFIEAASSGLPIVSTAVGVMQDVFVNDKSALITPINDKMGLVGSVNLLINDQETCKLLIDNAYKVINDHTYKDKAEYLERYKSSWEICNKMEM